MMGVRWPFRQQTALQVEPIQTRHVQIGYDARRVLQTPRRQELLPGPEDERLVPQRGDEIRG